MNDKVNNYIPAAIQAISTHIMNKTDGTVDNEYKGYIASMGTGIRLSGLPATIAFYSKQGKGNNEGEDSPEKKRGKLLDALKMLIAPAGYEPPLLHYIIEKTRVTNESTQSASDLNKNKLAALEADITNALLALKLSLRIFKVLKLSLRIFKMKEKEND